MATLRMELAVTVLTLILLFAGGWTIGYNFGKNSPCTTTESIDIKPIQ